MTNFEKYKEDIENFIKENGNSKFALLNGKIVKCEDISCTDCDFDSPNKHCSELSKRWINEDNLTNKELIKIIFDEQESYCATNCNCFDCKYYVCENCKIAYTIDYIKTHPEQIKYIN